MHFSAKRGRLFVCPSVTLVDCDHIGWNSFGISRLVSVGCSLSADPNIRGLLQGEHPEILAQSDPPSNDLSIGEFRMAVSAQRVIRYASCLVLTSRVGFSGSADRMELFLATSNPNCRHIG